MKRQVLYPNSRFTFAVSRYTTQRCFICPVKEQSLQMGLKELYEKTLSGFLEP
jgi:hypothetical protein